MFHKSLFVLLVVVFLMFPYPISTVASPNSPLGLYVETPKRIEIPIGISKTAGIVDWVAEVTNRSDEVQNLATLEIGILYNNTGADGIAIMNANVTCYDDMGLTRCELPALAPGETFALRAYAKPTRAGHLVVQFALSGHHTLVTSQEDTQIDYGPDKYEPNDTCKQATAVEPDRGTMHYLSISPADLGDWFTRTVPPGRKRTYGLELSYDSLEGPIEGSIQNFCDAEASATVNWNSSIDAGSEPIIGGGIVIRRYTLTLDPGQYWVRLTSQHQTRYNARFWEKQYFLPLVR
ncbi:hypothetical protein L6255_01145 [Candidatus Parcubacteria bacterium]|nr:hypothetical protein [Patescibacteria group bacterium]MCG2689024.1 hypothetical protein [Candidatus Parcubacteria bacterium]